MLTVQYVTEEALEGPRNGGRIRRDGLISASLKYGAEVEPVCVAGGSRHTNLLNRFRGVDWDVVLKSVRDFDVWHVEGLPLYPLVRWLRKKTVPVVWDVCDSWPLKYLTDFRESRRLRAVPEFSAAASALIAGAAGGPHRIYISERDLSFDAGLLIGRGHQSVVPNGVDISVVTREGGASRDETVMLGDWTYRPNARSYDWLGLAMQRSGAPQGEVAVYGRGAEGLTPYPWARRVGYRDDLGSIYSNAKLVLSPCVSGAGVKNKVMEAAAAGVPVITTPEGVAGGSAYPTWVGVAGSPNAFVNLWRRWDEQVPVVDQGELSLYRESLSWSRSAECLFSAYNEVMVRA